MLDFKIKDLKRAIQPREAKIHEFKETTNEMDKQLRKFNKINANLGYIVEDLRTK